MAVIGIPRALSYYDYFPLWRGFFEALGQDVVVSDYTNKEILEAGLKYAVDETCLPVKIYMGHVLNLRHRVDYLFIPRLVSLEEKHFNCPKFIGLPDMVKGCLDQLPPVLELVVDKTDNPKLAWRTLLRLGSKFTANPWRIHRAYKSALRAHRNYRRLLKRDFRHEEAISGHRRRESLAGERSLRIALLSHSYNICDPWASNNLCRRLEELGVEIVTADSLPLDYLRRQSRRLSENIYWTFEKKLAGAALHFLETTEVDGMILMAAFECGPDSLVAELIELEVRNKLPVMTMFIDEHSGEAGMLTRLEAFLDLIYRQRGQREAAVGEAGC